MTELVEGMTYVFKEGIYLYLGKLEVPSKIDYVFKTKTVTERAIESTLIMHEVKEKKLEDVFIKWDVEKERQDCNTEPVMFELMIRIGKDHVNPSPFVGKYSYNVEEMLREDLTRNTKILEKENNPSVFGDYKSFDNFMRISNITQTCPSLDTGFYLMNDKTVSMPLYLEGDK